MSKNHLVANSTSPLAGRRSVSSEDGECAARGFLFISLLALSLLHGSSEISPSFTQGRMSTGEAKLDLNCLLDPPHILLA